MVRRIEAGKAFVRVGADLTPLDKALNGIRDRFTKLQARISSIGSGLVRAGGGLSAVGASITAPIIAASKAFADFGDKVQKTSVRTGLSAVQLTSLGFAAEQSGSSMEELGNALFRANRRVANAATETGPAVRALKELGLEAKTLQNLDTESRFLALADALNGVENEFRRNQLGFEIFGDSFKQIQPLLREGSAGIGRLQQEARDLGITIDDLDAGNAAALGDALNRVSRTVSAAFIKVGAAVAVPFTEALNALTNITASVAKWIDQNREAVRTVFAIGAGLTVIGGIVAAAGAALVGVGAALASIATIAGTVAAGFAAIVSPVGLAVAAIGTIGGLVLSATGSLDVLRDGFGQLSSTVLDAWSGIVSAVSSGDLTAAGQIAYRGLEIGWLQLTDTLQQVWQRVANFFIDVFRGVVEKIIGFGASIYTGLSTVFDQLSTALQVGFDTAITFGIGIVDNIIAKIAKAIIDAQQLIGLLSSQDAEGARSIIDQDLNSRANRRQQGLNQRTQQRAQGLEERSAERQAQARTFADAVADVLQRQIPNLRNNRANERISELQAQQRVQVAQQQREAGREAPDPATRSADIETRLSRLQSTSAGSVGTFVSGVANNILGGGVQDAGLDAQKQTADNTSRMVDKLDEVLAGSRLT